MPMKTPAGDPLAAVILTLPSAFWSTGHARPEKLRSRLEVAIAYVGAERLPGPKVRDPKASRWFRWAHSRKPPPANNPIIARARTLPMTTSITAPAREGVRGGAAGGGAHWVVIADHLWRHS